MSRSIVSWDSVAERKTSIIPSGLPKNRNIDVFLSATESQLTIERLIELIKHTHPMLSESTKVQWRKLPYSNNVYFEHNFDLCKEVIGALCDDSSGDDLIRNQKHKIMIQAIVLASYEMKVEMIDNPVNISKQHSMLRKFYLCQVSGKRRDDMGRFVINILRPYTHPSQSIKDNVAILKSRLEERYTKQRATSSTNITTLAIVPRD